MNHSNLNLSTDHIECAFDYFLLFDRVKEEMNIPYDDPDAMARLLEERKNDLQLAAQIGKSLLERNRELDRQLKETELQVFSATETINQLQHTLGIKEELLHLWSHSSEIPDSLSNKPTSWHDKFPERNEDLYLLSLHKDGRIRTDEFDFVNQKIQILEEENNFLKNERVEEHSTALRDCTNQLSDAITYIRSLADEQFKRSDALAQQQHHLNLLMKRSRELENNLDQVCMENEVLASTVDELKSINQRLSKDLRDMKDKYDESLSLYLQAQSNIRQLRRSSRNARHRSMCNVYSPLPVRTPNFSLQPHPESNLTESSPSDNCQMSLAEELNPIPFDTSPHFLRTSSHPVSANQSPLRPRFQRFFDVPKPCPSIHLNLSGFENPNEHDDTTIASSGFASSSEPIENFFNATSSASVSPSPYRSTEIISLQQPHMPGSLIWSKDAQGTDTTMLTDDDDCSSLEHVKTFDTREDYAFLERNSSSLNMHTTFASAAPKRLQLIKHFHGSGILKRWQNLATPSITSALFESPLAGVHSRTSSASCGSNCATIVNFSTTDLDRIPISNTSLERFESDMNMSSHSHHSLETCLSASMGKLTSSDILDSYTGKFIPMFSPMMNTGIRSRNATAPHLSIDTHLSNFLSSQRDQHRFSVGFAARFNDIRSWLIGRKPFVPEHAASTRSLSPTCRGLLDVSELTNDPTVSEIQVLGTANVPPIRHPSSPPNTSGINNRVRKQATICSSQLNSVQE